MTRTSRGVWELGLALVCVAGLALGAADAGAQQGVTVDPESPSGKEYAIPLESARRQAQPQGVSPSRARHAAPAVLFGEGVVSSSGSGGQAPEQGGAPRAPGEARRETRRSDRAAKSSRAVPDAVRIAASRPAAPDRGVAAPILVLGLGLLVVLIGVVAGIVIRRRADA